MSPTASNAERTADVRSHFGLHQLPFTREIAVADRWRHACYDEALTGLLGAVTQRMSAALIGPAGTGKTVVLRCLDDALPQARYRLSYVKVTSLSKRDMCREISKALGCEPAGHYGSLVARIQERCEDLYSQQSLRPVLVLDEAHEIRPDVLGILRVLTNFDMDSRLVVSIVLAGQPPLRALLQRDELQAVSRRLAHYASLRLLSRDETRRYVEHRMGIAGATTAVFADDAHDAVYEIAQGNLRAIDRLALKSLEEAAAEGVSVVGHNHVARARHKVMP